MGPHILPSGWEVTGEPGEALRFEEFASTDLDGKPLDVSQRDPAARQLTPEQAASNALADGDEWKPGAEPRAR